MARIVEHLPVEELEARYRAARDATEARHFQAIWLLAQGRAFLDVAEVLAFAPRWVEELAARYNASGPEALGDRRRRNGRAASLLTQAVLSASAKRMQAPPDCSSPRSGACRCGDQPRRQPRMRKAPFMCALSSAVSASPSWATSRS